MPETAITGLNVAMVASRPHYLAPGTPRIGRELLKMGVSLSATNPVFKGF
jgi:hypothetical protein